MNWEIILSPLNITLAILAITMFFFVQGKVRSDLVALCALLALLLFNILEPSEAFAGFSNTTVLMMIGLFIVGGGIFRTGLAKMVGGRILKLAKGNENLLFILIMLVTAFIGAFVSNTGTVAIMMPIVVSMAVSAGLNVRRYLMPLAFASAMGVFTLISTPPNMVVQDILESNGYEGLSFFGFAPVGFVAVIVGIIILFFSSKLLNTKEDKKTGKNRAKSSIELIEEYDLPSYLRKIVVPPYSTIVGKSLAELQLASRYGIGVGNIVHKAKTKGLIKREEVEMANSESVILAEDTLYCHGSIENTQKFVEENNLILCEITEEDKALNASDYGFAEVYILPDSHLINHTVVESRFREQYNVNVLGIRSRNDIIVKEIKDVKMHARDALLISGKWEDIALLSQNQRDFVTIGQPEKEAMKVTLDKKAPLAAGILLAMVLVMAFNLIPSVTAVWIASTLMILTGCLRNMEEAYESINWNSIVLIAAMIPMSTAFNKTGITAAISDMLTNNFGSLGPYVVLAAIYAFTSILSLFLSNTATAVLFAPIAMESALSLNLNPYAFLIAVAVGASMCFASPFSTPPNALVMNAGNYTFKDYVKVGLPLQIVMGIVMILFIPVVFPF